MQDDQDKENVQTISNGDQLESKESGVSKIPSISDFDFIKPISKGAFGKVFLGQKKSASDKLYAIKVMKKADLVNKNLIKQVTAERDALAVARSPFIVQLYYSLQSQHNIFLVMEYLIGGDVKSLLAIYGYFDEDMAVMYTIEVALALEYLHAQGIIHRDLKPDNMLITERGHIKLTDFGLSKLSFDTVEDMLRVADPISKYNIYRTPGQILSLKSSLAFNIPSARKMKKPALFVSPRPGGVRSTLSSPRPLSTRSPFCSPLRNINTTSPLLRYSLTPHRKEGQPVERQQNVPLEDRPPPPIQSLTPTLRDSLNWSADTDTGDRPKRRHSSQINGSATSSSELRISSLFKTDHSLLSSAERKVVQSEGLPDVVSSCSRIGEGSCDSHLKAPSRQESFTDETPQLHRTDEAVWNSYAARNLRSMREGSYSEESEMEADARRATSMSEDDFSLSCYDTSVESGRFTSLSNRGSSGYSYPSDDETEASQQSLRHRARRRRSFEISDDSALSRRSSLGVHMMGVIQEEKVLSREKFSECVFDGSGTRDWRNLDGEVSECDISIGPRDERCRLTFQSSSSEEGVTAPSNTGLTQDIRILSFREDTAPVTNRCSIQEQHKHMKEAQQVQVTGAANTGLTQEIRSMVLSSHRKPSGIKKVEICEQPLSPRFRSRKGTRIAGSMECKQRTLQARSSGLTQEFRGLHFSDSDMFSNHVDEDCFENLQTKEFIERSRSRKRSFDYINRMDDCKSDSVFEPIYGDEHLRKRTNVLSGNDLDEQINGLGDDSLLEVSPCRKQDDREGGDSPPFTVVVSHMSPDPRRVELPPSPPSAPRLCVHHKKLSLSPVHGSNQKKHFYGEESVFKSPLPQRTRFEVCVCQSRAGHLNSKSSLKDSPAAFLTPDRASHRRVSVKATPLTPANPARTPFLTPFQAAAHRTPFRTPKSVRRGKAHHEEEQRILGTPDYLAPEILRQKPHGTAVDWWALGVCLFEFLTGLPPFNDQTPESVFENILNRDIPWPDGEESLSEEALGAIDNLLTMDPEQRPSATEVRKLPLLTTTDWDHILDTQPAFVPQPDDDRDTTYFEARNSLQNLIVSAVDL